MLLSRVTRLGELSPVGPLFTSDSFLKNREVSIILLADFFYGQSYEFILPKNRLGYVLGDFFHEPIGSPCFKAQLIGTTRKKLFY
jgi:hypothetical protein